MSEKDDDYMFLICIICFCLGIFIRMILEQGL